MTNAFEHHEGTVSIKGRTITNLRGINIKIKINGQSLETVTSFKCLGSVITDEGSKPEILFGIAQITAA